MGTKFFLKSKSIIGIIVLVISLFVGFTEKEQVTLHDNLQTLVDNAGPDDALAIQRAATVLLKEQTPEAKDDFISLVSGKLEEILGVIGSVLVLVGRITADKKLTLTP